MSHPEAEFLRRYLAPLKGATITSVRVEVEDDFGYAQAWPTLVVKTTDGERLVLQISQDEEGNGPGFIDGLPFPTS